jgi:hypothetical protein
MRVVYVTHAPQFVSSRLKPLVSKVHYSTTRTPLKLSPRPTLRKHNEARIFDARWRGAKTKTTKKFKDLPQGTLKLEPYNDGVDDAPRYPTVVHGHRNNMEKFKNCVILTRVGGFYEVLSCSPFATGGELHRSDSNVSSFISNKPKNLLLSSISNWLRKKQVLVQFPWLVFLSSNSIDSSRF